MSTYSSNLKIELIGTGEQAGTWGTTTNENFANVFEQAIVGRVTVLFATDANKTITATDTVNSQDYRNLYLNLTSTGSLTATRDLIVPTINKTYVVQNNTTGAQSIRVITTAGTGITIPNGRTAALYVNGANVILASDFFDINGGSIDGTPVGAATASTGSFTTLAASGDGTFSGTGQIKVPVGTTAQRSGTPADGMIRYNSDEESFEGYIDGAWGGISGAQANGVIYENNLIISANYTLSTGKNGMSVGPITIDSGVSVTIPSGQRWVVL